MKNKERILLRIGNQNTPFKDSNSQQIADQPKPVRKGNGLVLGYSANTHQGLVRNYNEDRVSIILNITKPGEMNWPKCSYFAIYDGHGGSKCADFLRDHLHQYIISDKKFPEKPAQALKNGFRKAEQEFKKIAQSSQPLDKSGSCAIVVLIVDQNCYIANVGDSRAIMSCNNGSKVIDLSEDHKPSAPKEKQRILKSGGSIYQSVITTKNGTIIPGPFRINPGRLSVSRAFGDITAKDEKYDGNPRVLISQPQIKHIQLDPLQHDFIVLGCDGIFDKMQSSELIQTVWNAECDNINNFSGIAVSTILKQALNRKSMDNVTAVMVMLDKNAVIQSHKKMSNNKSAVNLTNQLKPKKKDLYKVIEDFNKHSQKLKQFQESFKQNRNTNTLNSVRIRNASEHERITKKPSIHLSTKKLQFLKKTSELFNTKKQYENLR